MIALLKTHESLQSEVQKWANDKYYAKLKEDPQYREDMARWQKEDYNKNIEKHLDAVKKLSS